jgi:hypothetical protein
MSRSLLKLAAVLALSGPRLLSAVQDVWALTLAGLAERYRPEAHYMRGPGPKWRAKHTQISGRMAGPR